MVLEHLSEISKREMPHFLYKVFYEDIEALENITQRWEPVYSLKSA